MDRVFPASDAQYLVESAENINFLEKRAPPFKSKFLKILFNEKTKYCIQKIYIRGEKLLFSIILKIIT